jgi:hypothetical protein
MVGATGAGEGRQVAVAGDEHVADGEETLPLRGAQVRHPKSRRIWSAARQESAMIVNEGLMPGAFGKMLESAA